MRQVKTVLVTMVSMVEIDLVVMASTLLAVAIFAKRMASKELMVWMGWMKTATESTDWVNRSAMVVAASRVGWVSIGRYNRNILLARSLRQSRRDYTRAYGLSVPPSFPKFNLFK